MEELIATRKLADGSLVEMGMNREGIFEVNVYDTDDFDGDYERRTRMLMDAQLAGDLFNSLTCWADTAEWIVTG